MDINQFLVSALHFLSSLDFVETVDFHTEAFILRGKVILKKSRFLQIYFNEITGTTAFALVEKGRRIWGIDFDNIRGWHLHTLENPDSHHSIEPMTVQAIINHLSEVWLKLR
jgi:hypothetical protein